MSKIPVFSERPCQSEETTGSLLEDQMLQGIYHRIARSAPLFPCPEILRSPSEGWFIDIHGVLVAQDAYF